MNQQKNVLTVLKETMLDTVPAYANKFFYSLGFLSATCFVILLLSGTALIVNGPSWWLTSSWGIYTRSVHLWATQAFVLFVILHALIVFFTYAYRKPRQFTWVLGGLMFFLVLFEAEFGYILRGDFSSQWRSLQAADLFNGSGLGTYLSTLNYMQIYGIHIALLPIAILLILLLHYGLVRSHGIATPHRQDIPYRMVKANHLLLFSRGIGLIVVVLVLAHFYPSPLIDPVTIQSLAQQEPQTVAQTLVAEFQGTSDTATYSDNIDPYTFDTREVYVYAPYRQYAQVAAGNPNFLDAYLAEDTATQDLQANAAKDYYDNNQPTTQLVDNNPLIPVVGELTKMAQSGLYESALRSEVSAGYNPIYVTRFLSDTGVMDDQATSLGITTEQYGMLREESGHIPPGAWWLAPVGWLDHTILAKDDNQDKHGAEILGGLMLLFLAFPYIPILNRIPDKLSVYRLIWKDKDPFRAKEELPN